MSKSSDEQYPTTRKKRERSSTGVTRRSRGKARSRTNRDLSREQRSTEERPRVHKADAFARNGMGWSLPFTRNLRNGQTRARFDRARERREKWSHSGKWHRIGIWGNNLRRVQMESLCTVLVTLNALQVVCFGESLQWSNAQREGRERACSYVSNKSSGITLNAMQTGVCLDRQS